MRKASFVIIVTVLIAGTTAALAAGPITRDGADFDGQIPRDCPVVEVVGDALHVECTTNPERSDNARIRYRFLSDVGGVKAPATVSADIEGDCARVRWMAPVRTLRILVPVQKPACEVTINSVTWQQP